MFLAGCGGPCFNSSAQKAEAGKQISKFEGSLVYRMSSRAARATQRNPVSKNENNKTKKTNQTKRANEAFAGTFKKEKVCVWKP